MEEQKYFSYTIENMTYPICPKCGGKEVAIGGLHSACLRECGWIGPTSKALNNNPILKSTIVQDGYASLTSTSEYSLRFILQKIAREKDFPGATSIFKTNEFGGARCFIPKFDDLGEAVDMNRYIEDRAIKAFKLGTFTFMERVACLMAHSMFAEKSDRKKLVSTTIASAMKGIFGTPDDHFFSKDNTPTPYFFRKKAAIELDSTASTDTVTNVKAYSAAFGRPDSILEANYSVSGSLMEDNYPKHSVSDRAVIWQPFYWPALKLDNSEIIRLAGVLQGGTDNLNYVVTESMDSGGFKAGVYKRSVYEPGFQYVESKAQDVEDAVRRLRTSFEKTVVRHEESGDKLDFSWIKDWNYDSTPDRAFYEIVSAPFWQESVIAEMFHMLGQTKEQVLEEMYQEAVESGLE